MKYFTGLWIMCVLATGLFAEAQTAHDFKVTSIDGTEVNLSDYKGKTLVIVNTASRCGFTKQYTDLVKLQDDYEDKGVVVLGFPANNFGGQEPGSNAQIREFCTSKFMVDFPMFGKVSVKGEDKVPLFAYLTTADNPDFNGDIRWNFEKFIVDGEGNLRRRFRSTTNPDSKKFRAALEGVLSETAADGPE